MKLQIVGCSHHKTPIALREQLAFSEDQIARALDQFRARYPEIEAVLLSTCNRVELFTATENTEIPGPEELTEFLASFHRLPVDRLAGYVYAHSARDAVAHLFTVTSSLDSMVVGEPQILAQVKQAYQLATQCESTGPLAHAVFQAALKVAHRVADETTVHQRRVSIPSVAVADFAQQIFERFDDKATLLIGAGEMAEETLRYLQDEGAHEVIVANRSEARAAELARRWHGRVAAWESLPEALAEADLVIGTTGSDRPIVDLELFKRVEALRSPRPLFVLDLAVPRDFDPQVGDRNEVYLYSIDDLQEACRRNVKRREKELPAAVHIIDYETARFMAELHHRATSPIIKRLKEGWQKPKEDELRRLFNKLPELDDRAREEINQSFDRLINKLMHPPLESLRDESRHGIPHALMEALAKLFQLKD